MEQRASPHRASPFAHNTFFPIQMAHRLSDLGFAEQYRLINKGTNEFKRTMVLEPNTSTQTIGEG